MWCVSFFVVCRSCIFCLLVLKWRWLNNTIWWFFWNRLLNIDLKNKKYIETIRIQSFVIFHLKLDRMVFCKAFVRIDNNFVMTFFEWIARHCEIIVIFGCNNYQYPLFRVKKHKSMCVRAKINNAAIASNIFQLVLMWALSFSTAEQKMEYHLH